MTTVSNVANELAVCDSTSATFSSIMSVSAANLLMILPVGVLSKNDSGAKRTRRHISVCKRAAAETPVYATPIQYGKIPAKIAKVERQQYTTK